MEPKEESEAFLESFTARGLSSPRAGLASTLVLTCACLVARVSSHSDVWGSRLPKENVEAVASRERKSDWRWCGLWHVVACSAAHVKRVVGLEGYYLSLLLLLQLPLLCAAAPCACYIFSAIYLRLFHDRNIYCRGMFTRKGIFCAIETEPPDQPATNKYVWHQQPTYALLYK